MFNYTNPNELFRDFTNSQKKLGSNVLDPKVGGLYRDAIKKRRQYDFFLKLCEHFEKFLKQVIVMDDGRFINVFYGGAGTAFADLLNPPSGNQVFKKPFIMYKMTDVTLAERTPNQYVSWYVENIEGINVIMNGEPKFIPRDEVDNFGKLINDENGKLVFIYNNISGVSDSSSVEFAIKQIRDRAPLIFDITFQCQVWCNTKREGARITEFLYLNFNKRRPQSIDIDNQYYIFNMESLSDSSEYATGQDKDRLIRYDFVIKTEGYLKSTLDVQMILDGVYQFQPYMMKESIYKISSKSYITWYNYQINDPVLYEGVSSLIIFDDILFRERYIKLNSINKLFGKVFNCSLLNLNEEMGNSTLKFDFNLEETEYSYRYKFKFAPKNKLPFPVMFFIGIELQDSLVLFNKYDVYYKCDNKSLEFLWEIPKVITETEDFIEELDREKFESDCNFYIYKI